MYRVVSDFAYLLARQKYAKSLPKLSPFDQSIVDAVNREGVFITSLEDLAITSTSKLLTSAMSIVSTLQADIWDGSIKLQWDGSTQVITLTDYQDIFLWGLEKRLLNIVENCIGLPITYHGVNLRRNIPKSDQKGREGGWHKDGEDRRVVKIIIYLNDISEKNGPFEYIPKPLTPSLLSFRHIYPKILKQGFSALSDDEIKKIVPESQWKACLGPAGTVIFVDTRSVFHHGKLPREERSSLFFVYTSRHPTRPDICKANFIFDKDRLLTLAKTLPQHQRDCLDLN
jgi:hypothetical protein